MSPVCVMAARGRAPRARLEDIWRMSVVVHAVADLQLGAQGYCEINPAVEEPEKSSNSLFRLMGCASKHVLAVLEGYQFGLGHGLEAATCLV